MFGRIVVFLLTLGGGIAILRYTYQVVRFAGKSAWAEGKMAGGTFTMWKIIAIVMIIFGFLYLIGEIPSFTPPAQTQTNNQSF